MHNGARIGRPWKAALLLAAGAAGGGAAYAVASVPDGTGVIHACYQVASPGSTIPTSSGPTAQAPNIRIIDPSAGQRCTTSFVPGATATFEAPLDWNATGQQGPQGIPGTPGAPGKSVTIGNGNTFTISGGQVITVGGGNGVTIVSPTVSERGPALGHASFTGNPSFDFDVRAVRFAITQGSSGLGTGGGAGKVSVHELSITKVVDKSSPKLNKACATGGHFKTVKITLSKGGQPYLSYVLNNTLISGYQIGSFGAGGTAPTETVTLSFTKLQILYLKQKK